jgi:hypothetical protein
MTEKKVFQRVIESDRGDIIFPDKTALMREHLNVNDVVCLPVNIRSNKTAFWEEGGRHPDYAVAVGSVISTPDYGMPNAILFNKKNRKPNGRQALIPLPLNHLLFMGKVFVGRNSISVKVFELRLSSFEEIPDKPFVMGDFIVQEVYTTLSGMPAPAEQLVNKLFNKSVLRTYYANGWMVSDVMKHVDTMKKLYELPTDSVIEYSDGDKFVAGIENDVCSLLNKGLSPVIQLFDFKQGIMTMSAVKNMSMTDYVITDDTCIGKVHKVPISAVIGSMNKSICLHSDDPRILEMVIASSSNAIEVDPGTFIMMRGYKG